MSDAQDVMLCNQTLSAVQASCLIRHMIMIEARPEVMTLIHITERRQFLIRLLSLAGPPRLTTGRSGFRGYHGARGSLLSLSHTCEWESLFATVSNLNASLSWWTCWDCDRGELKKKTSWSTSSFCAKLVGFQRMACFGCSATSHYKTTPLRTSLLHNLFSTPF